MKLNGALDVFQSLTYGTANAKFNSNGFLTLKSTISGTAWIGPLATTNTISGDVTVERYINLGSGSNKHKSTWQLVATPTQGKTIKQTWMENGNNASTGYGTQITDPSGVAGGFEAISQTPSLKYYNAGYGDLYRSGRSQNHDRCLQEPGLLPVCAGRPECVLSQFGANHPAHHGHFNYRQYHTHNRA